MRIVTSLPHEVKEEEHVWIPVRDGTRLAAPGVGDEAQGADILATDLDANPRPDLMVMAYDSPPGQNSFPLPGRAERGRTGGCQPGGPF